jgi:hypothetical protein
MLETQKKVRLELTTINSSYRLIILAVPKPGLNLKKAILASSIEIKKKLP